jgi:hypothetical protein
MYFWVYIFLNGGFGVLAYICPTTWKKKRKKQKKKPTAHIEKKK